MHIICVTAMDTGMDIPDHLLLTKFKVEKAPFIWYSCGIFRFFGAICKLDKNLIA